jgi:hypothetical protein
LISKFFFLEMTSITGNDINQLKVDHISRCMLHFWSIKYKQHHSWSYLRNLEVGDQFGEQIVLCLAKCPTKTIHNSWGRLPV